MKPHIEFTSDAVYFTLTLKQNDEVGRLRSDQLIICNLYLYDFFARLALLINTRLLIKRSREYCILAMHIRLVVRNHLMSKLTCRADYLPTSTPFPSPSAILKPCLRLFRTPRLVFAFWHVRLVRRAHSSAPALACRISGNCHGAGSSSRSTCSRSARATIPSTCSANSSAGTIRSQLRFSLLHLIQLVFRHSFTLVIII